MAMEDLMEDERRETSEKFECFQSVVRSYELKAKNAHDDGKSLCPTLTQ
jgi:hypothetical protein